jgi:hypothetical protein
MDARHDVPTAGCYIPIYNHGLMEKELILSTLFDDINSCSLRDMMSIRLPQQEKFYLSSTATCLSRMLLSTMESLYMVDISIHSLDKLPSMPYQLASSAELLCSHH